MRSRLIPSGTSNAVRDVRATGFLLVTVLIWSGNYSAVKIALGPLDPMILAVARFGIAGAAAFVLAEAGEKPVNRVHDRRIRLALVAGGVGVAVNQAAFVAALSLTTASNVSFLIATIPIFTTLFAVAFARARPSASQWLSLPIGALGVIVITTATGGRLGGGSLLGDLLAVVASMSWAAYSLMIRPLLGGFSPMRLSAVTSLVGAALLIPFAVHSLPQQDWSALTAGAVAALLYSTLLAVVLTNVLYFVAVAALGAATSNVFLYLQPLLGVLIAFLVLGEVVFPGQLVGGFLVIVSVVIASRSSHERQR